MLAKLFEQSQSFLDCGFYFRVRILLSPWFDPFREDCAGGHDFDEVCAVLEIGPDRFDDFLRTVGQPHFEKPIDLGSIRASLLRLSEPRPATGRSNGRPVQIRR